jgi:hypothetical protein
MSFETAISRPDVPRDDDIVLLYADDGLVLDAATGTLPRRNALGALVPAETVHVGRFHGAAVETARIETGTVLPAALSAEPLRA